MRDAAWVMWGCVRVGFDAGAVGVFAGCVRV